MYIYTHSRTRTHTHTHTLVEDTNGLLEYRVAIPIGAGALHHLSDAGGGGGGGRGTVGSQILANKENPTLTTTFKGRKLATSVEKKVTRSAYIYRFQFRFFPTLCAFDSTCRSHPPPT